MGNADKRRKRAREKAKQARLRKGVSPWQRPFRDADCECFVNANWRDCGLADLTVIRPAPDAGYAMVGFLVDLTCLGLKDAFCRLDILPSEIKDHFREITGDDRMIPADMPFIRGLVRSAIRWSHEHHFRLPRGLDRTLRMIGGIEDWRTADVSAFGTEDGKLRYVGTERALRDRLIECTVDDFLDRDDVEYDLEPEAGAAWEDDFEDDEFDDDEEFAPPSQEAQDAARALSEQLAAKVRESCLSRGETPNLLLPEAAMAVLGAMACAHLDEEEAPAADAAADKERFTDTLDAAIMAAPEQVREPFSKAILQVITYITKRDAQPLLRLVDESQAPIIDEIKP